MKQRGFWILVWSLLPAVLSAQSYLWPTNASKWLTSSFGESRARRFHAGIDIKTWNRTGYEVYASRAGYIWRVRVSPFGYGRVLYLKADTGEILVYAHLERFAPKIQEIVEAHQERTGRYSLTRTFSAGALPVTQGEIIAYTGESGVGVPHLHFEIRDSRNRPTNPLLKNFDIPDNRTPVIRAVSILPLNAEARVNGDVQPVVLTPSFVRAGEYRLEQPLEIFGEVGFAISAWDRPGPVPNRIGVHQLRLYVDGRLQFQTRYELFDLAQNRFIELDRNYLLARRGFGRFYNLFRHPANVLPFYDPNTPWAGVLTQDLIDSYELTATPGRGEVGGAAGPDEGGLVTAPLLAETRPGAHRFEIEVADFFGNLSKVEGQFVYGPKFRIVPKVVTDAAGGVWLRSLRAQPEVGIVALEVDLSQDGGETWRRVQRLEAVQLLGNRNDSLGVVLAKPRSLPRRGLLRLVAFGRDGVASYPAFTSLMPVRASVTELQKDAYPTYMRVEVAVDGVPARTPRLVVRNETGERRDTALFALAAGRFAGVVPFGPELEGTNRLEVILPGEEGDSVAVTDAFYSRRVTPGQRATVYSPDGNSWVQFFPNSAYSVFYSRLLLDPLFVPPDSDFVTGVYVAEPKDLPFNRGARIFIRYPAEEAPQKLGVYYEARPGKWVFIDNEVDSVRQTVSARVLSLERFALIRDTQPPQISNAYPPDGTRLRTRRPLLKVRVKDERSGLADEERVFMLLDGRRVPAEYDPEADELRYRPRRDLEPGKHTLVISAEDQNGNRARHEATFWVQ
jgi:hypothetical protein